MASSIAVVEYLVDNIFECGEITYKKMFGDYCIYIDGKVLGFLCDDVFYVKRTKIGEERFPELEKGYPYKGASLYPILDIEDREFLITYINTIKAYLPEKTKKRPKPL